MSVRQKAIGELEEFGLAFLYFAVWFLVLVALKKLILADYQIGFYGLSAALVGALIVAKVVLVLEYVPLGNWVERRPVIVDVVLRTALYSIGVLIAVILEHGFERRHEHGGFTNAVFAVVAERNMYRVWATTIGVGTAILAFNVYSVFTARFGTAAILRLFFKTPLRELRFGIILPVSDSSPPLKAKQESETRPQHL
jgi:hypothetical protein